MIIANRVRGKGRGRGRGRARLCYRRLKDHPVGMSALRTSLVAVVTRRLWLDNGSLLYLRPFQASLYAIDTATNGCPRRSQRVFKQVPSVSLENQRRRQRQRWLRTLWSGRPFEVTGQTGQQTSVQIYEPVTNCRTFARV